MKQINTFILVLRLKMIKVSRSKWKKMIMKIQTLSDSRVNESISSKFKKDIQEIIFIMNTENTVFIQNEFQF